MFPIFLSTKTQEQLCLDFKWSIINEQFDLITLTKIKAHIDLNPLLSEFLELKENFEELGEELVIIKDIYWKSGKNFILSSDMEHAKMKVESNLQVHDAVHSLGHGERRYYIRESEWKINSLAKTPILSSQVFKQANFKLSGLQNLDKKSFKCKSTVSESNHKGNQAHALHISVKKLQYESPTLSEIEVTDIVSRQSCIEFCKFSTEIIEKDMEFENLHSKTQIKPSDIYISNKEKLLDMTTFSLTHENTEIKMIVTYVKFVPDNHDKIITSFSFATASSNTSKEEVVLCKWVTKDIITPEQQIFGSVGITSFLILNNSLICGLENGNLTIYDLQTFKEIFQPSEKSTRNSPIVYLHSFEGHLTAIGMDFTITSWTLQDDQHLVFNHEVFFIYVDCSKVPSSLYSCRGIKRSRVLPH